MKPVKQPSALRYAVSAGPSDELVLVPGST